MPYILDTTVSEILDDTNAVKILEEHIPGVSRNPMPGLAKGMTLKSLLAMPQAKQAGITEEMVKKVSFETKEGVSYGGKKQVLSIDHCLLKYHYNFGMYFDQWSGRGTA